MRAPTQLKHLFPLLALWLTACATLPPSAPSTAVSGMRTVKTATGRIGELKERITLEALARGVEKQANASKSNNGSALAAFEVQKRFPPPNDFAEIRALFKSGDEIWWFDGLDRGWVVLRDGKEIYQLATDHDW